MHKINGIDWFILTDYLDFVVVASRCRLGLH